MASNTRLFSCGILDLGNGYEDLVVNPQTGDLICIEHLMGNLYVDPITLDSPTGFESRDVAISMCKSLGCDGVALTSDYLITFKNEVASFREVKAPMVVCKEIEYDTNSECTTLKEDSLW